MSAAGERPSFIRASQHYRPDIDILRAIAVGSVLLFHAGLPGVPGGFVGVDMFFVISGYLISRHLLEERARSGTISIADFYKRRVRRIAPVLLTVLAASACAATLLLFPAPLTQFAGSLAAATLFVSNLLFWRETGYFAAQDSVLPLLHTWSLSIEEQFYIVVPVLIAVIGGRRVVLVAVVVGGFAVSLGLSAWQSELRPALAFYLLPTRAWESLFGTILALRLGWVERFTLRLAPDALAVPAVFLAAADFHLSADPQLLRRTIGLFRGQGKRVSVLFGLPFSEHGRDVPLALAMHAAFGTSAPRLLRQGEPMNRFARSFRDDAEVRFIDLAPALCSPIGCRASIDGYPVYSDAAHVSYHAAAMTFGPYLSKEPSFAVR